MRKVITIIVLGVMSLTCYAQDFLHSKDYIYGCGATDDDALISLAKQISAFVETGTVSKIKEINGEVTEEFVKTESVTSNINVTDTEQQYYGGKYYRYINKSNYINSHLAVYRSYIEQAKEYDGSNKKHELNLILGCYYKAYEAINTPLMEVFSPSVISYKAELIRRAKTLYNSGKYGILSVNYEHFPGYYVSMSGISDPEDTIQPATLIGFEYKYNGEWLMPYYMSTVIYQDGDIDAYANDDAKYKMGLVKGNPSHIEYRKLYEEFDGMYYIKISVPDEWYFETRYIDNPRCL